MNLLHVTWQHICMWACHVRKWGKKNEQLAIQRNVSEQCMILSHVVLVPAHALQFCSRSGSLDCDCKIAGSSAARCTHKHAKDRIEQTCANLSFEFRACIVCTDSCHPVILQCHFCQLARTQNSSFSAASKARAWNLMYVQSKVLPQPGPV